MDTDLIISFLISLIFCLLIIEWDEAFFLFIVGLLAAIFALNTDTIFDLATDAYQGGYNMIQIVFAVICMFAFIKTYFVKRTIFGKV